MPSTAEGEHGRLTLAGGIHFGCRFGIVSRVTPRPPYRHAPLVYVILQVTHPLVSVPISRGEEAALKAKFVGRLPLVSREQMTQLEFQGRLDGGQPSTRTHVEEHVRFSARDKRTSVTFAPNAVTVETTRYETWEDFRAIAETGLAARMDVAPVDGVERIGLRYVDEVRIPGGESPDWRTWVEPQLAPPVLDVAAGELFPYQQQSVVQFKTARPGVGVVLRYGAVEGPSTMQGLPLFTPKTPPSAPFFLVDTDASWTPAPGDEVPPLEPGKVLDEADVLHGYVKDLFEASLTDRLRSEVLDAD